MRKKRLVVNRRRPGRHEGGETEKRTPGKEGQEGAGGVGGGGGGGGGGVGGVCLDITGKKNETKESYTLSIFRKHFKQQR